MNIDPNKKNWRVTDILVSVFMLIAMYVLFIIVISAFFKPSDLFLQIVDNIFKFAPIYYLNNKYPIKIFSNCKKKDNLRYFLIGTGLCFALDLFYGISAGLTRNIPDQYVPERYALFMQYNMFQKLLDLVNSVIVTPVLEEIFFRGFIYRILRNRYNVFWGALLSTIIFSLFHGFKIEIIIDTGIAGLIFVYVYQKTESIPLTALTHSVGNGLWLVAMHYALKG
jgi:membrane protease YdiL (CAAX protease family)